MSLTSERPLVRIVLSACERTVTGGTSKTTWLFYDGNQWSLVKDYPDATFTRVDCGPGVLWETLCEVTVPIGTWLTRVDRTPDDSLRPRDPMVYLQRQVRTRRYRVRRSHFRVNALGKLVRMPREKAPL